VPGTDLVVILGNAVNGTDWDGVNTSYFEDLWDRIMEVIIENKLMVSFTLGNLDTKGNIKDPNKIIKYINSYGNLSMTFPSPTSIDGNSFYGIPIKRRFCFPLTMQQAAYLIFMDSNTRNDCPSDTPGYQENGCVSNLQIDQAKFIVDHMRASQT
jgi:hypothetical protein